MFLFLKQLSNLYETYGRICDMQHFEFEFEFVTLKPALKFTKFKESRVHIDIYGDVFEDDCPLVLLVVC